MDATIVDIFAGLPLQGPGTDRDTLGLLDRVRAALSAEPRVADLGCGTGRSTFALARAAAARRGEVPLFAGHVEREIEVRRTGEGSYGYTFYVLRPR